MDIARILIAMNNESSVLKLKSLLVENGYIVVDQAKDGHEALRKVRSIKPDIAVIDYDLPLLNGVEVAKVLLEDGICDVLLLVIEGQLGIVDNMKGRHDFVCMAKPLNRPMFLNTLELMVKNIKKVRKLEKEIEELKSALETRKEVERAKGLLMKHLGLSENEAFKRIQKQSMDKGMPMKDIAKAIIIAYDI